MSNKDTRDAGPYPRFGVLLNSIIEALEWNDPEVISEEVARFFAEKTTDNYLKGLRVKPLNLEKLCNTVANCLLRDDILPVAAFAKVVKETTERKNKGGIDEKVVLGFLTQSVQQTRDRYEALNDRVSEANPPHTNASWAALRLLAIEIGLRYGALLKLENRMPDNDETARWYDPTYEADFLKDLLKKSCPCAPLYMSTDPKNLDWASRIGVETSTLTRWLNGEHRPSYASLKKVAFAVLPGLGPEAALKRHTQLRELRRHYALCRILRQLRDSLGEKKVSDLLGVFHHTAAWALRFLRYIEKEKNFPESFYIRMVIEGRFYEPVERMLPVYRSAIEREKSQCAPDDMEGQQYFQVLLQDVDALIKNRIVERIRDVMEWSRVGLAVAKTSGVHISENDLMPIGPMAQLSVDMCQTRLPDFLLEKMSLHQGNQNNSKDWFRIMIDMERANSEGNLKELERLARQGINRFPQTGVFHYTLGRMLLLRHSLDEAEQEFRIAFDLIPSDDLIMKTSAWIHVGHCLIHSGHASKAVHHLETIPIAVPDTQRAEFRYILAIAFYHAGEFKEAVNAFTDAAVGGYSVGESYAWAAKACGCLGDKQKERDFAKKARELGINIPE